MTMTFEPPNASTFPNATLFPNSKVWNLSIKQFGKTLASFKYVQVVDGTGAKLPVAYGRFVTEQNSNPVPGNIFFRGVRENQPLVVCGGGI